MDERLVNILTFKVRVDTIFDSGPVFKFGDVHLHRDGCDTFWNGGEQCGVLVCDQDTHPECSASLCEGETDAGSATSNDSGSTLSEDSCHRVYGIRIRLVREEEGRCNLGYFLFVMRQWGELDG